MQNLREIYLLLPLLLLFLLRTSSASQYNTPKLCGKIQLQPPFFTRNSTLSSPLSKMVICKSNILYFRTSIGLIPISSIDYTNKLLTISHSSCSSKHYFDQKDLKCSHYSRVYKKYVYDHNKGHELGTRISFDVPDNVTDVCRKCDKQDGNCSAGLKCICHPHECKDRVVSLGATAEPMGMTVLAMLTLMSWFATQLSF